MRSLVLAAALLCPCAALAEAPGPAAAPALTATSDEDAVVDPADAERARVEQAAEARRLEAERKKLEAIEAPETADRAPRTIGAFLLQTALMLVAICALAYLTLGKLLPKVMGMSAAGRRALIAAPSSGMLQVVDRLALDPRRSLIVVKVGDEHYLVGMTDSTMTRLAKLDDTALPGPTTPQDKPLLGAFGRLLERRLDKEGS